MCVREQHFYYEEEHCIPVILAVEGVRYIEFPQLALHICVQQVSDPQSQHLVSEALLEYCFLLVSVIWGLSIFSCRVAPKNYYSVVYSQIFTLEVSDRFIDVQIRRYYILDFRRLVGIAPSSAYMKFFFGTK